MMLRFILALEWWRDHLRNQFMINPQLLVVAGVLLIAGGLFASPVGWLAAPITVGVIALVYAIALEN